MKKSLQSAENEGALPANSTRSASFVDVEELFDMMASGAMPLSARSSIGFGASREMETPVNTAAELFDAIEAEEFVPKDSLTEIFTESLEATVGYSSLIRQLNESVRQRITFFMSESGGSLSHDEARRAAFKKCEDVDEAKRRFIEMARSPVENITFYGLAKLWDVAPRAAEKLWEQIKLEGRKEFESGHFASNAIFPTSQLKNAWQIAKYLGMRDSFIAEWKPKDGIEVALIDMLAQSFYQWQFWLEQTVLRSQAAPRVEHPEYRKWRAANSQAAKDDSWDQGYWFPPTVDEKESLDQAVQMADRFHRMFTRSLRSLRDLRRYSPVTINNPKQVNIATDGSKQANIAE